MTVKTGIAKSPWIATKDRAAEREAKREALLLVAAQAFSEKGYHRTSLDDIAKRLGITKPTLYYYAANKEELLGAVATRALDQILRFDPGDPRASGLEHLRQLIRRYAEIVATDVGRCLVRLNAADLSDETNTRVRDGKKAIDQQIRSLLQKGQLDGSIAECDTRLTTFMLAGAVNGIGQWFKEGDGLSGSAVGDAFMNQLCVGLAPRK